MNYYLSEIKQPEGSLKPSAKEDKKGKNHHLPKDTKTP